MPNPFPGMDPYLEGPAWPVVHSHLIAELARQLSSKLNPKYVAWTYERVVVSTPEPLDLAKSRGNRLPDVSVLTAEAGAIPSETGVASAVIEMEALVPETLVQTFLEVREAESRVLVTAIEMLSPTNKRGDGLVEFRKKRFEYLSGPAHYLEIDLLRTGERFPTTRPTPSVPYFVFLSRVDRRPRLTAWPIALDQSLPTVNVPLLVGDDDVLLDLQSAWSSIYELFRFHLLVDHSKPPTVALPTEQAAWASMRVQDIRSKK